MNGKPYKVLNLTRSFGRVSRTPVDYLEANGCELVAPRSDKPLTEEKLVCEFEDIDAVVVGTEPLTARVISSAPRLKVISKHGVGVDNIDLMAAKERGIPVTITPGANSQAVAELTIGFIFSLARDIPRADRSMREGKWERIVGVEVRGKSLGLIGFGRIGRIVCSLARGIGMRVLVYDPYVPEKIFGEHGVTALPLEELLKCSDFVSLHLPLSDDTRGIMTRERLSLMCDRGTFFINTSRGELVDEEALFEFLEDGRIKGAALDVYSLEPPQGNPLLSLDNVVLAPHMGAYTREALDRMGMMAARNVVAVLTGKGTPEIVAGA